MKVLTIDDHALFREGLVMILKKRFPDAEIVEAGTIAEALERFSFGAENTDLILSDLLYPGSGEPFVPLQALLSEAGDIPVIVISALESEFYVDYALKMGARGYLYKSRTMNDVVQAISQVGRGGIYRPSPGGVTSPSPSQKDGDWSGHVEWCGVAIPNRNCVSTLTPRQHDVLRYLMQGLSNKEIAKSLGLFEGTVKIHLKAILHKLGAQNRTQAVLIASKFLNGNEKAVPHKSDAT